MITIVFHPDVFIFQNGSSYLLYDSLKGRMMEGVLNECLRRIFKTVDNVKNLYRCSLSDSEYDAVQQELGLICQNGFAELYQKESVIPFSYPPKLKMDIDLERIKNDISYGEGGRIINYLHQIVFYLEEGGVNQESLCRFLNKVRYCPILEIDICIPSPSLAFSYNRFILSSQVLPTVIQINAQSWTIGDAEWLTQQYPSSKIEVTGIIPKILPFLHQYTVKAQVSCDEELEEGMKLGIECIPFYNGKNIEFCSQSFFTRQKDLTVMSKRDIFLHQTLNTNYFGRLFVSTNGAIRAAERGEIIGTLNDSVYDLVKHELMVGRHWLLTRRKTICAHCLFCDLCPCISHYELEIDDMCLCWRNNQYCVPTA